MIDSASRPRIVVMGVSGSGKTTTGQAIAQALDLPFVDADDLHPAANKALMRQGIPLTDDDRAPWLTIVGERLGHAGGVVIACSALRRAYRDRLRELAPDAVFVHLRVDEALVADRLATREHEFMPASLLASQFATLEIPTADEPHIDIDSRQSPETIAAEVAAALA